MTLGSAFYLLNHCVDESEICLISRLKSKDNLTEMGGFYLDMWTVLLFQFHIYWSLQEVQHSKTSCYFQTVAELCLSVHDSCPSKPRPFALDED